MARRRSTQADPAKVKDKKRDGAAKTAPKSTVSQRNRTSRSKRELENTLETILSTRDSDAAVTLEQLTSMLEERLEGKRKIARHELLEVLDSVLNGEKLRSKYSLLVSPVGADARAVKETPRSSPPPDRGIGFSNEMEAPARAASCSNIGNRPRCQETDPETPVLSEAQTALGGADS